MVRAGLGEQYDISEVETVEAASRYVAKYMFKRSQFTDKFPAHWHRVRYGQAWPKLPKRDPVARILLTRQDWGDLAASAVVIDAKDVAAHDACLHCSGGRMHPHQPT